MKFDEIDGLDKLEENLGKLAQVGVNGLNKGLSEINKNLERVADPNAFKKSVAQVPEVCPYCGAKLEQGSDKPVVVCEYCGSQFDNSSEKTIVDSVFDFVEKQQKFAKEEREFKAERERVKAELKLKKRKKTRWIRFVFLIAMVLFMIYYCLNFQMGAF